MIPFSGNPLNRASEKRGDAVWIAAQRRDPSCRVLPLWKLKPLLRELPDSEAPRLSFLPPEFASQIAPDATCVFLGLDGQVPHFALDISAIADPVSSLGEFGQLREARPAAMALPPADTAIFGQAKSLIDWHARHGFCANCGQPTVVAEAGWRRDCLACKAQHFPRVDPVVIMLAVHDNACLVGRGPHFTPNMYSALAGFIEPGETIEEAVRRELMEEVGLKTGGVTYHAAQPWPFPSTLMIGCFAQAESRDLIIDKVEIEDARWLDRETVHALFAGEQVDGMILPQPIAIAHHLLKAWLEDV